MSGATVVPGAIAAISAESIIKEPAEAAIAPDGATSTATAGKHSSGFWVISIVA